MANSEYLSTGEAARILNISRSTVSRRFDSGLFKGKTNPITGERLIAVESIVSFVEENRLPIDPSAIARKSIVLAAAADGIQEAMRRIADEDSRFRVTSVGLASDALITCSKEAPDLLALDDQLPDIALDYVIGSLRRRAELKSMRILCCCSRNNAEAAAAWGADDCLDAQMAAEPEVLKSAICGLLGMPRQQRAANDAVEHRRRWRRFAVSLPARIAVYRVGRQSDRVHGRAVVRDISEGGAFISQMRFDQHSIPADPFRLHLSIDAEPLKHWEAACQVVRLRSNGMLTAGLEFEQVSDENRAKIRALA